MVIEKVPSNVNIRFSKSISLYLPSHWIEFWWIIH